MLEIQNSCLVVVDVQGKLAQLMMDKESLFKNIRILIQAARILDIPILWCQQVPESLGPTVPEIAELLAGEETDQAGEVDDDDMPEEAVAVVSRPGDLWVLGEHRVLCGDATDPESYARLLLGERAGNREKTQCDCYQSLVHKSSLLMIFRAGFIYLWFPTATAIVERDAC